MASNYVFEEYLLDREIDDRIVNVTNAGTRYVLTPESSVIRGAMFFPGCDMMNIWFRSGKLYNYRGVEENTFDEFVKAESVGKFFNKNIRYADYKYQRCGAFEDALDDAMEALDLCRLIAA